jgi:hypothetical protein
MQRNEDWIDRALRSGKTGAQIAQDNEQKGSVMNTDTKWVVLRYAAISIGSFLAGKGYVTMDQVNTVIDRAPEVAGAAVSLGTMIWGIYVRLGTKAVPAQTAARRDVPTVSPVTGATIAGKES